MIGMDENITLIHPKLSILGYVMVISNSKTLFVTKGSERVIKDVIFGCVPCTVLIKLKDTKTLNI